VSIDIDQHLSNELNLHFAEEALGQDWTEAIEQISVDLLKDDDELRYECFTSLKEMIRAFRSPDYASAYAAGKRALDRIENEAELILQHRLDEGQEP
jgi:hypothetical protein